MGKYKYVVKTKQVDGVRYKAYGKTEREALRKLDSILFEVRQNGQKSMLSSFRSASRSEAG